MFVVLLDAFQGVGNCLQHVLLILSANSLHSTRYTFLTSVELGS